jgi:hypothetical protein
VRVVVCLDLFLPGAAGQIRKGRVFNKRKSY